MSEKYTKTFEFVPEFEFDRALFDEHRSFYIRYRRKYQMDAGTTRLGKLIDGSVESAWRGTYAGEFPFTHLPAGELVVSKADTGERRGRYTFGGYDFTVISTTNDRLGAIAMKHMYSLVDKTHKINGAALNTSAIGGSKDGRTLLIDHNSQRVYSLARNYEPKGVTYDNVDLGEVWSLVPKEIVVHHSVHVYCVGPNKPVAAASSIRVTLPERKATAYSDTLDACVAWFKMEGLTVLEYRKHEIDANSGSTRGVEHINVRVSTEKMVKGFASLTPYERARAATVNAKEPMPRKQFLYYCLGFDNDKFFQEVNDTINSSN